MAQKGILIRTALDVRKYGAVHSGSPLMTPSQTSGAGAGIWVDWVPSFAIGGTTLDPTHVTIYKCCYTIWGIMIFWQVDIFINDSEGLSGDFTFSKPPYYTGFEGHGTGVLAETNYWQSITAKANSELTYLIVQWWDGWVLFSTWHPDSCYISLQGIGVAKP